LRTVFAAKRGYERRRGWLAWHIAILPQMRELPELHDLTGDKPVQRDPEAEAERRLEILRAWKAARKARRKPAA
jgi:hypothetical protein